MFAIGKRQRIWVMWSWKTFYHTGEGGLKLMKVNQ